MSGTPGDELIDEVILSVRGEATATVDPDLAILRLGLTAVANNKSEASIEAGRRLDALLGDLALLGGVARTSGTTASPLTWTTTSVASHPRWATTRRAGGTDRRVARSPMCSSRFEYANSA